MPPTLFLLQILLAIACLAISPRIARAKPRIRLPILIASLALLLAWPLSRIFSIELIALLGAPLVSCIELTGIIVPGALALGILAHRLPRKTDRTAVLVLIILAAAVALRSGWWMIQPGVGPLGPTRMHNGVCLQSRDDTCVAASLVTLLRHRGIDATEERMAELAGIEPHAGATDSRTLWALQRALKGAGATARYQRLDVPGLIAAPKPCLVQLRWGFFTSHMVPVLDADAQRVTIGDPLEGPREMSMADFTRQWKGRAITVTDR